MCKVFMLFVVAAAAAVTQGQAFGQTMYKCKGPDGAQIFSHQPCPDNTEQVDARGKTATTQAFERTEAVAALQQRKNECLRHANALAYNQADLRIRQHNDRIAYIEGRMATSSIAGTDRETEMRGEIADLQQSVVNERSKADTAYAAERQRCEDDERRATAALADLS